MILTTVLMLEQFNSMCYSVAGVNVTILLTVHLPSPITGGILIDLLVESVYIMLQCKTFGAGPSNPRFSAVCSPLNFSNCKEH
jgi:hypothetical protein